MQLSTVAVPMHMWLSEQTATTDKGTQPTGSLQDCAPWQLLPTLCVCTQVSCTHAMCHLDHRLPALQ